MVSNRRLVTADGPDFYPTPAWGTKALLKHVKFDGCILEPCCGDGAMSEELRAAGYSVISSDVVDRGYGMVANFLDVPGPCSNVVTNPPFNVAEELLAHALEIAEKKVCFLLRSAFVESKRRYNRFYKYRRPSKMLVFTERLSMYPRGQEVNGGGTTSYAWFVWDKTIRGRQFTEVEWIEPGLKPGRNQSVPQLALTD